MGLGMPEVVLVLVIALIVFGPRKLPELGKSLGQAMAQFRKASDDFKRTWEQEVELETVRHTSNQISSEDHSSTDSYSYDNYSSDSSNYIGDSTYETESHVAGDTAHSGEATEANAEPSAVASTPAASPAAAPAPEKQHWI